MKVAVLAVLFGMAGAGCVANYPGSATAERAPPMLLGEFVDDYGGRFTITVSEWLQHPANRYRVVRWNEANEYLIAQNGATNSSAPNLWTRIDWMQLSNMAPYEWAFCLSSYDAPTAAAAEATEVARRETPRTGCNGFPFSRMRPIDPKR